MKLLYTNVSPVTKAYTNINHVFHLKKQKPQKVFLCVWDNYVFESPVFSFDSEKSKETKLNENVLQLEKLMQSLGIDYKIIYLSEAWSRLFRNKELTKIFQNIISSIKLDELKEGFLMNYIPFGEISLSRVNYIIADYLIATYLPELYPEICNSQPTVYLTSERFKIFQNDINNHLKSSYSRYSPVKVEFVNKVPVIIHKEKKNIPSSEMSKDSIKKIVKSHYEKVPNNKEIYDLSNIFLEVLTKLEFKKKNELEKLKYDEFVEFVTENLYKYFNEINKITEKIKVNEQKKNLYVHNHEEFNYYLKQLNPIKLEILKNCNGNNTSLDISKKTGLKLSTVSTYITQLRLGKIIDNSKKPRRLIDSFVIDLEVIEKWD